MEDTANMGIEPQFIPKIPIERKAISVPEAAKAIGLSAPNCYALIKAGKMPGKQVGKRWLVPVKALERWLESQDD